MLPDVGKVGVSDTILKKPARPNPAELERMKFHTVYGARLFANSAWELDRMAAAIALNHHENGTETAIPATSPASADKI